MAEQKPKKKVAETLLRISVAELRREGLLWPGVNEGIKEWPKKGGRIKVASRMEEDGWGLINFIYTIAATGEECDVQIQIEPTPCRYGGIRHRFRCCRCYAETEPSHLSSVLYFDGRYFVCRKCCNMIYRSQTKPAPVPVSYLDTFDTRHLYYKGKKTRRFKRIEKLRNKAWTIAEGILKDNERRNKRFKKLKAAYQKKFARILKKQASQPPNQ